MTTEFDQLQALIDALDLSDDDKRLMKIGLWTHGGIPLVKSAEQYAAYGKICDHLSATLPARDSTGFGAAFVEWSRSSAGIQCMSYGARMIEWEEEQAAEGQ